MKLKLLDQFAGDNPVADELNDLLRDPRWQRLRIVVAFARWSGLSLIHEQLEEFVGGGGTLDAFIGIDLGGTTIEALDYLHQLPNTRVRVVHANASRIVFHPKAYLFDDGTDEGAWTAVLGSSNLSTGGLWNNAEAAVLCAGRAGSARPFEPLWARFDGIKAPLTPDNIIEVDEASLKRLAKQLKRYSVPPPDSAESHEGMEGVPPVSPVRNPPPVGRPPLPGAPKNKRKSSRKGASRTRIEAPTEAVTLYLEQWKETGGGGTQTQIPKRVAEDYFGHRPGVVTWLTLHTPTGANQVRLSGFDNVTYRITLGFTGSKVRPAVLRFKRIGEDEYEVDARSKGERGYQSWKRYCTQGRSGAKQYGFG